MRSWGSRHGWFGRTVDGTRRRCICVCLYTSIYAHPLLPRVTSMFLCHFGMTAMHAPRLAVQGAVHGPSGLAGSSFCV